jgi:hypothetical protein
MLKEAIIDRDGNASYGDDRGLLVEFVKHPVFQEYISEQSGRIQYSEEDFIRIDFPGDRTKSVFKAVNPAEHPFRFPRQWAAFLAQSEQVPDGTPVTEWAVLSRSEALNLKGMKIHTVESLAALPDTALQSFLGATELREKAKHWLAQAKDGEELSRVVARNAVLEKDLELLKKQVEALVATATPKSK